MPQTGFTVMVCKLVGCEDKLLQWSHHLWRFRIPIKCIDGQLPIDLHRIWLSLLVEVDASAETPYTWLAWLMQYRISPDWQYLARYFRHPIGIKPAIAHFQTLAAQLAQQAEQAEQAE